MSGTHGMLFRQKWAFVIGYDEYSRPDNKLNTSMKNANKLTTLLKKSKFKFMKPKEDSTDIMEQVQEFTRKIEDGDLILFYFSGHGYQLEGKNYLIPTDDSRIDKSNDVIDLGTSITSIVKRLLSDKPSCMAIVILDCCRPYVIENRTEPNRKWFLT